MAKEGDPIHNIALCFSNRCKTDEDGIQAKCHCEIGTYKSSL